ncbi:hypothetical protein [Xanthomonas phage XPP8]|nr:hypothetical protein [Xanthomonas phage XPP8]
MKSIKFDPTQIARAALARRLAPLSPAEKRRSLRSLVTLTRVLLFVHRLVVTLIVAYVVATMLASCSSLGKPERQRAPVAPDCSQRAPALDSGDPPSGADATDWMAWARAYVIAQWAIVDRDNKRAATADCLDKLSGIK